MSIAQTDAGLSRYYENAGVDDYNEKFEEFCQDNGFDDDDVKEELNQDPEDCTLIEFDELFPLPIIENQTKSQRDRAIFNIIKKCWNDSNAYKDNQKTHVSTEELCNPHNFEIPQEKKQQFQDIYEKQCPAMYKDGAAEDDAFLTALMMGRIYDVEYLQHLFDLYMRDSVEYYKKKHQVLQLNDWTQQHPYFQRLRNNQKNVYISGKNPAEIAEAAVKSFSARICPKLLFNATTKIRDSLEETTKYVCEAVQFVTKLAQSEKQQTCPFQVDICIAFPEATTAQDTVDVENDDDDDDDDTDVDYGQKDTEQKEFTDCIGDIKSRLNKHNLQYVEVMQEDTKPTRIMGTLFQQFNKEIQSNQPPRRKRFVTVVDRRQEMDRIIMFEPPQDVRDIPVNAVPEWYFNSSKACIIPGLPQKAEKKEEKKDGNEEETTVDKMKNAIINSGSQCQGAFMTLSFHVKHSDSIKCYLYYNGQITRFFPSDIMDILPLFFDLEFEDNVMFAQDQDIKAEIEVVKDKLVDRAFNAFGSAFK